MSRFNEWCQSNANKMKRMQNRKLKCFKDEIYMEELKEWWMDAQNDVADCFEYSKCHLNAKNG